MIPKEMIGWLSQKLKIENEQLIEKDLYLQGLLSGLGNSEHFAENYVFKGGTCLTKAHFGYYRFSEDLDFTRIKQDIFKQKSQKQSRKAISTEITKLARLFSTIAKNQELDFKPEKHNNHYIQLGGSNRFTTFKFWYTSTITSNESFVKIQINFHEILKNSPKKLEIKPLAKEHEKQLMLDFPQHYKLATTTTKLYCYSLEEIASEKIRALLTRRGFKARDVIDLYMLSKKGITMNSIKKLAIEKTKFMLKYLKYSQNLESKKFEEKVNLGQEESLIITPLNKGFPEFAEKTLKQLNKLIEEMK
ncbi:MAG: nucleotidyl transferase AbiEii/AbiGii toxin family protein [Candidatus Diapherotrites archaeon]|uniref:Nucleotidyl transferase AbiEii/AbiGii toxin family protein n=2 Tax=Candidatus Iainarchaeum sp. TaxID=3101447 RepID=A0A8T4KZ08_9ARCH|nr:nucleotidyl transferase AbiEii/AbiGii toxin family protein [Candidatus Diapherotrites archaeon]